MQEQTQEKEQTLEIVNNVAVLLIYSAFTGLNWKAMPTDIHVTRGDTDAQTQEQSIKKEE